MQLSVCISCIRSCDSISVQTGRRTYAHFAFSPLYSESITFKWDSPSPAATFKKTITYFAYSQLQQIETAISCYLPLISWPVSICFLQLPAPGQLTAVWDGTLQKGSLPAVLSAITHRQPQRVGRRRGRRFVPAARSLKRVFTWGCAGAWSQFVQMDICGVSLLSCSLIWTRKSSPWLCRLL